MARQTTSSSYDKIVYDDELISHVNADCFDSAHWPAAEIVSGIGRGRGKVLFIDHEGRKWVLRHYCRGGLVRHISDDEFLWIGLHRTRAFREWELLDRMHRIGLPVPRPVAARVKRRGVVYTADLITERLADVTTLSERLAGEPQGKDTWRAVGQLIARFHSAGICHADLNVHNIQIDPQNRLYLLDFDRGRVRDEPGGWMQRNLDRLHQSLAKLSGQGVIRFEAADWKYLLDGYRSAMTHSPGGDG